jgi:hypothetical protein
MSHLNQKHVKQGISPSTNWESVVLLSLVEIADKVINESRVQGEFPVRHRGASHEVKRAG